MARRIRVLDPLSAWGGGHVQTCINLLKGMHRYGADVHLDLIRAQVDMGEVPHGVSLPKPISRLGLTRMEKRFRRMAEQRYLAQLSADDIAWLWPGTSFETWREVKRRGHPIIMEGINTRIASARRILDAAYEAEGLRPAHGANEAAQREEEELLSMATHFFSPSPNVDAALREEGSSFRGHMMQSSYGAWGQRPFRGPRDEAAPVTVLFSGTVCIRKNAHGLLRAWAQVALPNVRLVLCGRIEPAITRICADELSLPSVVARGHVRDVVSAYRAADLFIMPSLEEGDPQVTYEAASFGLPILASPMGGGRLGERTEAVYPIDPYQVGAMVDALSLFIRDRELRAEYGVRAADAAPRFDWNEVGRERFQLLCQTFDGLGK